MDGDTAKKVLLFVTDQPELLKVVTSFLSKRNFSVFVETEIKETIVKTFELKPDFIFIAWDHPDQKIVMLPKLLGQSTASIIIPFINKSSKESVFKFENCPINPKLFPPISGPAVERVVLKSSKEDQDYLDKVNKFKSEALNADAVLALQNDLANSDESDNSAARPTPPPNDSTKQTKSDKPDRRPIINPPLPMNLELLKASIDEQNSRLDEDKAPITEEQKSGYNSALNEMVIAPLENVLAAYEQGEEKPQPIPPKSNIIFQKSGPASLEDLSPIIQTRAGADQPVDRVQIFKSNESEEPENYKAHCIWIISQSWCGYFVVFSRTQLDFRIIEVVFTDWIKTQMKSMEDITERDYFEFFNVPEESITDVQNLADYSEFIQAYGHDFRICFFGVEPKDMKLEFSEERQHLKLFTRDIPPGTPLDFNLLLHLPENQKYLLYTQKFSALSNEQKTRLLSKNVTLLFTSIENEYEYRKFLAKKTFNRLFEIINNKLSPT